MGKKSFKPGTMVQPVPAVMVSCSDGEKDNIITIGWTGIVNTEPPMTYVSIRESRLSFDIIKKSKEFVINLTTEKLVKPTDFCGVRSGRDYDKFDEMNLTKIYGEKVKCPMIGESPINIECKVTEIIELGSHHMFLAEIVGVHVDEDIINMDGRFAIERAGLIAYAHGNYFPLKKESLGSFGFSIMKPKTKKRKAREKQEKRIMKNKKKNPV